MKIQTKVHYLIVLTLLLAAGAVRAAEKPVKERGWIGGTYEGEKSRRTRAEFWLGADHTGFTFPAAVTNSHPAGMLVTDLGTNTPAYAAGLRAGDLILELGRQPITDWPGFWQTVGGLTPGTSLPVKAWRNGQMVECQVTVGREKYQRLGWFSIGLPGFFGRIHLVPTRETPGVGLLVLGYEKNEAGREELASVTKQYEQACHPKDKPTGYDTDWRVWLAIFEVKCGKKILAQEMAPAGAGR